MKTKTYLVADLFCGAGGSSTGAEHAVAGLGAHMVLVCVNHWPLAIETHRANHPTARHYVEDVSSTDPERIVPEGYLDLLMASPECRFFSRARGGKPVHDQSRMNPWAVQRWLTALNVRTMLVENVPEFVDWGPLNGDNRPDQSKKGLYFEAWVRSLWELGYVVDWKFLNAADYGDATTRTRFFLQARKDGRPIHWPDASHTRSGNGDMLAHLPRWRAAREIIDWENPGRSLLDDPKYKKKPLSVNTRRRIARGLQRYGGEFAPLYINLLGLESDGATPDGGSEAFTLQGRKNAKARDMGQPISTITASNGGGGISQVRPEDKRLDLGQQSCATSRSTDEPLPTVACAGAISIVYPQLVVFHGASDTKPVEDPVPSLPTKAHIGLVQPQLVKYYGTKADTEPIDQPLSTVTTKGRFGLVNPVLIQTDQTGSNGACVHSTDKPVPTIVTKQNVGLVEPVMLQVNHGDGDTNSRVRSVDEPLQTLTTKRNIGVVEPVLLDANGDEVDPRRLVLVGGKPHILDIRFRMLQNRELARAMGFDDDETEYEFIGNVAEVTKQIGNAVPVNLAAALVTAVFQDK